MAARPDFEVLFQLLPNAYMVLDRELRYVAANETYLQETASRIEDLVGRYVFELFPNDRDDPANLPARMLRESFERVLTTARPDTLAFIPYRVPRAVDGQLVTEERYWSATHVPLLDPQGAVQFIVQHTVDVTELHEANRQRGATSDRAPIEAGVLSRARAVQDAQQAIDAERRQLRAMFDQAPGFMCFLEGPDNVFTLANAAYQRLVGGERPLVGLPLHEALPEVVGQGFAALLERVRTTGEPHVGSGTAVSLRKTPDGPLDEHFVDFVYQPVLGADGAIRGIFVQGNDVTARVKAERESERARRAAEAFSAELLAQSQSVEHALAAASLRIQDLEAKLAERP